MAPRDRVRLRGLDPAGTYRITCWAGSFGEPIGLFERAGDELMSVGLALQPPDPELAPGPEIDPGRMLGGDFQARIFELVRL